MDNLGMKRVRLRLELQAAYGTWLQFAEARARSALPHAVVELSGSPKENSDGMARVSGREGPAGAGLRRAIHDSLA